MKKKSVVFDIRGDFACFRKFYTNSSILSYPFPPPTVIQGIIASLIGIRPNRIRSDLQGIEIAVLVLSPIRTTMLTINFTDTSETHWDPNKRTQIPVQFLKKPAYKIFVIGDEESDVLSKLESVLTTRTNNFHVYLGTANCLAYYEYAFSDIAIEGYGETSVNGVVPLKEDIHINPDKLGNIHVYKEIIPAELDNNRKPLRFVDAVLPVDGKSLYVHGKHYKVREYNVITF
jgi:CRISPR-associated protein Cas5h